MTRDFSSLREIPAPDLWPEIERELELAGAPRLARRRLSRLALVLCALAIAGTGIGVAVRALLGGAEPTTPVGQPVIVATLPIAARDIAIGEGYVWALGLLDRSSDNQAVFRINSITNHVVATIPIPGGQDLTAIATGAGSVWVLDPGAGTVIRIDPATNRIVATVALGDGFHPLGLAASDDTLYVDRSANGDTVYVRVDPRTNRVIGPPITAPWGGWVIPVGPNQVANFLHGTVITVDWESQLAIVKLLSTLKQGVGDVAAGQGAVWVAGTTDSGQGALWRIDARSHQVDQVASIQFARLVAVSPGSVWVATGLHTPPVVVRFDPATERIVGEPVSLPFECSDAAGIKPFGEGVWIIDCPGLIRIEPAR
jgi:streptogramin lyase